MATTRKLTRQELAFRRKLEAAHDDRALRTPTTEALEIVTFTIPKALAVDGHTLAEASTALAENVFGPMLEDGEFTEDTIKELIQRARADACNIDVVTEAVAYCVLAIKAHAHGDTATAWSYAVDASYWAGVIAILKKKPPLPKAGQLLAVMRHTKTYEQRATVADYWREHIDRRRSAEKAADDIKAANITTLSHKKIAEIVSALRRGEFMR